MDDQKSLIQSFNTDLFLRYNQKARFKIQGGYAGCVFVNGHSLGDNIADSCLYHSLYTFDSSRYEVGGIDVVDSHIEPSNEVIGTYINENDSESYNTVDSCLTVNPPHNSVSILYDSQGEHFYVKGKTKCSKLISLTISSDTSTGIFQNGIKKLETGRIIKLNAQQNSSALVTLIKTENIIFSGLKYLGGTLTVAIDASSYNGLVGNIFEVVVNPREIEGDEEGNDERTIKIASVSEPVELNSFTVNISSEGNHDSLDKDLIHTAAIEPEKEYEYDFEIIYDGELYSTELYVSTYNEDEDQNKTLITSPINNTQPKTVFIDNESGWVDKVTAVDGSGFIHVHIDSSSDFWFRYATCEDGSDELPYDDESYDFLSGWRYEQALQRPEKLVGNQSSFALLRANPKLTGNIKVVVDSNGNIFLDTFKVSNTLSNSAFRKISVDKNEYYGKTLMKKFRNVSSEEIFKVEDYCYDIFSYAPSLNDQYYDLYNYGVRTNSDKMYSENFSFLAPIKIKKVIPDFFVIFRVEPNENGKYYDDENEYSTAEHIKYFLENGKVVKTYDMRKGSNLGDYIRKFYEESREYSGDCYVTYDYTRNNAFNGISIDKGVVIQAQESNALTREVLSQVALNNWLTLGFERNRIVSKDIINLEFMFDDTERETFSLGTYFGLYIRLNGESEDFSCIGINNNGFPIFDYEVTGKIFNPSGETRDTTDSSIDNKSLIYGMSTPNEFKRLSFNIQDSSAAELMSTYAKKPYENISHVKVIRVDDDIMRTSSYASIKFEDVLDPGEHFRIINVDGSSKDIYEVIISNVENKYFDISEVHNDTNNGFNIHTLSIYNVEYRSEVSKYSEKDKGEILKRQLEVLATAFNSFDTDAIECSTNGINSVSIVYKRNFNQPENLSNLGECTDFILIEKVTSIPGASNVQRRKQLEYVESYSKLFGFDDLYKIYVNPTTSSIGDILYPFGFEFSGTRLCYASFFTPLMRTNGDNFTSYLIEKDITKDISNVRTVLFKVDKKDNEECSDYDIYEGFEVSKIKPNGTIVRQKTLAIPGFGESDSYVVKFYDKSPDTTGGYLNFFNSYPINAGLCSIFSVKDPFTDILDVDHKLNGEPISEYAGEYNDIDVYGTRCYPGNEQVSEDDIGDYFDKYKIFRNETEDDDNYIVLLTNLKENKRNRSDIPLIFNYCCKFDSLGTDKSGNQIKIMFDISNYYRNVIDYDGGESFIGFITIDNNKLNQDIVAYPKYINNNLVYKDHIEYKDYILYGEGSISDLLYFNGSTKNKFSVAYKYGNDSIEFISSSLKIKIKSNNLNVVDLAKYDGYSAILICCAGNNPTHDFPIDLIIDEVEEEIAVIYYVGLSSIETVIGGSAIGEFKNLPHFSKLTSNEFDSAYFIIPKDNISKTCLEEINTTGAEKRFIFFNGSRRTDGFTEDKLKWGISNEPRNQTSSDELKNNYIITDNSDVSGSDDESPILFSDGLKLVRTQESVEKNMYSNAPSDLFMKSDIEITPITSNELIELLKENKCGIFIKSQSGTKNFSDIENVIEFDTGALEAGTRENTKYETLLTKSSDKDDVYSSAAEVVFKDMFDFNYYEEGLSSIFEKSLDGCNIRLVDVSLVNQLFMKKYKYNNDKIIESEENEDQQPTGIVEHKNLNPLMNCFDEDDDIFKIVSDSSIISQTSLQTGYEKNTFFGSRGLCLKSKDKETGEIIDEIYITEWKDSDTKSKKNVSLNITSSIINYITKSSGFKSIWKNIDLYNVSDESKYIENTIMKFISIDETSKIELYRTKTGKKFKFNTNPGDELNDFELVDNFKNSLSLVKGNYILDISDLEDNYEYAAKITIRL